MYHMVAFRHIYFLDSYISHSLLSLPITDQGVWVVHEFIRQYLDIYIFDLYISHLLSLLLVRVWVLGKPHQSYYSIKSYIVVFIYISFYNISYAP